jgi:hypothetical protein
MSTQNEESKPTRAMTHVDNTEALPHPPMLWLLVPAALLALLAFLSRS